MDNLTIWDVKDVFNKVKNVVMNYTEMEAKVREATNNEPWGASSTLMQEIAQGTYNYQYFNEIMPTIYKRFTEKEARQWRQIYKALVLLEYLVKHGSERVVDDARAHMATIKIMRNFSYIDEKNKDQGVNVRNRAKELAELLGDVEKIRMERKKAKANRTKYTSVSSDSLGYGGFGTSRYGGFSSDSFGYSEERTRTRYDDLDNQWQNESRTGRGSPDDRRSSGSRSSLSISKKQNETSLQSPSNESSSATAADTEVDLFDFNDPPNVPNPRQSTGSDFSNIHSTGSIDDDFQDFQDFQSAPTIAPPSQRSSITPQSSNMANQQLNSLQSHSISASSQPVQSHNDLIDDLLGSVVPVSQSTTTSVSTAAAETTNSASTLKTIPITPMVNQNSSSDFPNLKPDDIWVQASNLVSLDSLGMDKNTNSGSKTSAAPSMNTLAQTHNSTAWAVKGTWGSSQQQNNNQTSKDPFDLLL